MSARLKCLLFPLLLLATGVQAAALETTAGFYQGLVAIESRDEAARQQATREALVQVLVRLTGDVSVSLHEAAMPLIRQAGRFVRSYRFVVVPGEAPDARGQGLQVEFDPVALVQAVKQQGLPLWDDRRPVTAVWMLGPGDTGPREILGRQLVDERLPGLQEAAQRRGVPLVLPLVDGDDLGALSEYDIVAQDYARIEGASARYQARHLLLLRLLPQQDFWDVYWSFLRDDAEPVIWRSSGVDPDAAIRSGFDQYADQLAQKYALSVAAGWVQSTRLRLLEANTLSAYARSMTYLEGLNLVDSVRPVEVIGGDVVYLIKYEGGLDDLKRSIELGEILVPAEAPTPAFAFGAPSAADSAWPPAPVDALAELPAGEDEAQIVGPESGDDDAATPAPAVETPAETKSTGLSFFAITRQPELRYRMSR